MKIKIILSGVCLIFLSASLARATTISTCTNGNDIFYLRPGQLVNNNKVIVHVYKDGDFYNEVGISTGQAVNWNLKTDMQDSGDNMRVMLSDDGQRLIILHTESNDHTLKCLVSKLNIDPESQQLTYKLLYRQVFQWCDLPSANVADNYAACISDDGKYIALVYNPVTGGDNTLYYRCGTVSDSGISWTDPKVLGNAPSGTADYSKLDLSVNSTGGLLLFYHVHNYQLSCVGKFDGAGDITWNAL